MTDERDTTPHRDKEIAAIIEYHEGKADAIADAEDPGSNQWVGKNKDVHDPEKWLYHDMRACYFKELVNLRNNHSRALELNESMSKRINQLLDEVRTFKEQKAALADVIAELKMDLKATE